MKKLTTLLTSLLLVVGMVTMSNADYKPIPYKKSADVFVTQGPSMPYAQQFEGQLYQFKLRDDRKGESRMFVDVRTPNERNNGTALYTSFSYRLPYIDESVQRVNLVIEDIPGGAYELLDYPKTGDSFIVAQMPLTAMSNNGDPTTMNRGDFFLSLVSLIQTIDPNVRVNQIIPAYVENHAFAAYAINGKENRAYVAFCNNDTIGLVGYRNDKKVLSKNQLTDFINRTASGIGVESTDGKKFITKSNAGRIYAKSIRVYNEFNGSTTKIK